MKKVLIKISKGNPGDVLGGISVETSRGIAGEISEEVSGETSEKNHVESWRSFYDNF